MNEQMIEPCPFCNDPMLEFVQTPDGCARGDKDALWVVCDHCGAMGPTGYSVDDAITKWNTRATQPQAPQEALGGWIRWGGGECPIKKDIPTEVRLRGEGVSSEIRSAGHWFWSHDLGDMDIVAYRAAPTETPEAGK